MGYWEDILRDADDDDDVLIGALIRSPGAIKSEMDTVDAGVKQLDSDIMASTVRQAFKQSWRVFVGEWQKFYAGHQSWTSRLWHAAYEKTIEYRRRLEEWRQLFVREGGSATGPSFAPPSSGGGIPWRPILIGAAGAIVAGVLLGRRGDGHA
jgi:hypothetical protein